MGDRYKPFRARSRAYIVMVLTWNVLLELSSIPDMAFTVT